MARRVIDTFWDRKTRNDINDNFEELYGEMNGEVAGDRIKDNSITPNKTSFFTENSRSKNLFDGKYEDGMLAIRFDDPNMRAWKSYGGYKGKTAVRQIKKNTSYAVKSYDPAQSVFRVVLFTDKPIFGDTIANASAGIQVAGDAERDTGIVFNSGNHNWMAVYVSNNGTEVPLQIEENNKITAYEPSQYIPSEFIEPIGINGLDFLVRSDNLFEGNYIDGMMAYRFGDTELRTWQNYSGYKGKTALWELKKNTNYVVRAFDETQSVFRAGLFASKPNFGTSLDDASPANEQVAGDADLTTGVTFNSGNYNWLAVYVSNNGTDVPLYINEGSSIPENAKAPFVIPAEYLEIKNQDTSSVSRRNFVFYEDMKGEYNYPTITEGVEVGSSIDIRDKSSLWFWGKYDALMSAFPGYITKKRIGYGSALDGTPDTNLPIYEYTFRPIKSEALSEVQDPTFLCQSAFHGNEKGSAWSLYLFMKEICEAENRNDAVGFLRRNITFRVVPIINPWGFDRFVRKNVRNIDMNNNFETDFTVLANKEADYYGGEEPMTEQETLTMDKWYAENSGPNTIGLVDMHNFLTLRDNMISWNISRDVEVRTILQGVGTALDKKWKQELPGLENIDGPLQWTEQRISGTARNQAYKKYGIKSVTIDPLRKIKNVTGAVTYDKYSIQVSSDILGATVVGMVRNFIR